MLSKEPQEVPGFIMESLKSVRKERPDIIGNISPLVYNVMVWEGHVRAGFWCYDNRHEASRMLNYGAVCKGYRPVPGSSTSYRVVSDFHKQRYGERTMTKHRPLKS